MHPWGGVRVQVNVDSLSSSDTTEHITGMIPDLKAGALAALGDQQKWLAAEHLPMSVTDDCFLWNWVAYVLSALTMPTDEINYQVQHVTMNGSDAIVFAHQLTKTGKDHALRLYYDPLNTSVSLVGLHSYVGNSGNQPPPPILSMP